MINYLLKKVAGTCLPPLLLLSGACHDTNRVEIAQISEIELPNSYIFGSARPFGRLSDSTMAFFDLTYGLEIKLTRGHYFEPFQTITLPNQLNGRVFSFYIQNTDSVLIHEVYSEYNKLTWLNGEGTVLKELPINQLFKETIETYSRSATPLIVFNNKAIVYLDHIHDPPHHLKNSRLPLALAIQLDSFKATCTFAKYPAIYQSDEYHFLTSHNRPYVVQLGGDTTLWGFHATPEVHIYKGCELIKTKKISTTFIPKVPGFPLADYGNSEKEMAFAHGSPAYSYMYYNPWQRMIYRIILPEQNYKNPDGSFNLHENRKFVIQAIDDKLNLLAEKLITKPMNFQRTFTGPLGLYIGSKEDENENSKVIIYGVKP
jgi:hypothetical protein